MFLSLILTVLTYNIVSCHVSYQPEQVHLAYGESATEIVVTWSTINDTKESVVEYGIGGFILTAVGSAKLFVDGGPEKNAQYIHKVTLPNLARSSKYGKPF